MSVRKHRKHSWSRSALAALGAVVLGITVACAPGSESGGESGGGAVRIGSAGEGGTYYYLATGMSQLLKKNTDLRSSAVSTAGGTENLRRVASGDLDLALATVLDLEAVLKGDKFDIDDFRLLATGHLTVMQPVVRMDSGITSLAEMAKPGRRLGVGEPGSAIQPLADIYLKAHGTAVEQVTGFEVSQSDAAAAMKDGQLQGAYFGGGVPLSAVTDLTTTGEYRVLPIDDATFRVYREATAIKETTVPADTYQGQPKEIATVGIPTILAVGKDMPEQQARTIVEAVQNNIGQLEKVHPAGAEYTVDNAFIGRDYIEGKVGLKYHPGAIASYEERGAWKPLAS